MGLHTRQKNIRKHNVSILYPIYPVRSIEMSKDLRDHEKLRGQIIEGNTRKRNDNGKYV